MNDPKDILIEQETQSLPLLLAGRSAAEFQAYLRRYQLEPIQVALACGVRYLTIWKMQRGKPLRREDSMFVRQGLEKLTGVAYTAPIFPLSETEEEKLHHRGKEDG